MPSARDLRLHDVLASVLPYHCLMDPATELSDLFDAFERTGARTILEIGTYKGATAAAFGLAFPEARVTTIDLPEPEKTSWNPLDSKLTGGAIRVLGVKNVDEVRMSSANLGAWVSAGRRFDMIFVDGDHSTEGVARDILYALDLLAPGGCVVAHDYTDLSDSKRPPWTVSVYEGVEEVLRRRPGTARRRLAGWLVELRPVTGYVPQPKKPRVLLVSDVPGWAFDQNNHDLAEYLADDFDFEHFYVVNWHQGARPRWTDYDAVFECFHRNPAMGIPYDRAAGALRSQWFKTETPVPPNAEDVATANRYRAFQVAVRHVYDALVEKCPNVVYLTNPVNMRRFPTPAPLRADVVAEWNGNSGHRVGNAYGGRLIKHLGDVIVPACQQAKIPLHVADYMVSGGASRRRPPSEMPAFYQQANVALCASEYEAASNSCMEAMASGLALIATDVGNHREMMESQIAAFGDSGIVLVEGTVEAFAAALLKMAPERLHEMGRLNRAEIAARWSWDCWRDRYRDFLKKAAR